MVDVDRTTHTVPATGSGGPAAAPSEDFRELEARRYSAMLAADLTTLDALFADDLRYVHSTGAVDTKSAYLGSLGSGAVRYIDLHHTVQDVIARPGIAIAVGSMTGIVHVNGTERTLNTRISAVWAAAGDQWELVALQSTSIPG